jgi:hypothetical protein
MVLDVLLEDLYRILDPFSRPQKHITEPIQDFALPVSG